MQALAIGEVGLTAQELSLQLQVVVGLQQLWLGVEQAQDHARHERADWFGIADHATGAIVRQPLLQPQAAYSFQSPARQQWIAAGCPAAQELGVALSERCGAERCCLLRLNGSGDVSLRAVIHQQAGFAMRSALFVRPWLQAGRRQLRDQRCGQWQR